jgi:hypothetical protein
MDERKAVNIYFASRSLAQLEAVCEGFRVAFDLPEFAFDTHDTWRYGWSEGESLRLNITRARDFQTIESWIPDCPTGANYQLILTTDREPPMFVAKAIELLGADVVRYHQSQSDSSLNS